jgi:hypothetical protein
MARVDAPRFCQTSTYAPHVPTSPRDIRRVPLSPDAVSKQDEFADVKQNRSGRCWLECSIDLVASRNMYLHQLGTGIDDEVCRHPFSTQWIERQLIASPPG